MRIATLLVASLLCSRVFGQPRRKTTITASSASPATITNNVPAPGRNAPAATAPYMPGALGHAVWLQAGLPASPPFPRRAP